MNKLIFGFLLLLSAASCKKDKENATKESAPCTECIIEGTLLRMQTGQPHANKPVALRLNIDEDYSVNDPFVMTDDSGHFKITYYAPKAVNAVCIYPKWKKYNTHEDLCIMGHMEIGKHYKLGKIYTTAYFP